MYKTLVCLLLLMAIMTRGALSQKQQPLPFEAKIVVTHENPIIKNREVELWRLLRDGEKFCLVPINDKTLQGVSILRNNRAYFYDAQEPKVVWHYSKSSNKAILDIEAGRRLIFHEIKRIGLEKFRERYHISSKHDLSRIAKDFPLRPEHDLKLFDNYKDKKVIRRENYLGRMCKVYFGKGVAPDGSQSSIQEWVTEDTIIVLKSVSVVHPSPSMKLGAFKTTFEVTYLKYRDTIPIREFQLPARARAMIGKLFEDIKLPPDVIRHQHTDPRYSTGLVFD